MIKTFRYRLYPSKIQKRTLESTLETCRRWYNECLAERKDVYEMAGVSVSVSQQQSRIKDHRRNNPYAGKTANHILQVATKDLDKAFRAFFRRVKNGENPGYPRFKGKGRFNSFGYQEYGNSFKLDGRRLKLTFIGRIAVRWHRPIEGKIKTLRVIRKNGKWYACFACEVEPQPLAPTEKEIGIDVGLSSLLTTSDGEHTENPRWYREEQSRLRVLQRCVSRRKMGGSNRRKAVKQLQNQHEKIANRRKDFLDKTVCTLVEQNDLIAIEDLQINNMVRNHRLSKSILDAGWGHFRQQLNGKAEEAGRVVVAVNPSYTSKTCSNCGALFEGLTLADRWVTCECGLSLDRDHNAAINILKRAGQARSGKSTAIGLRLPEEPAGL